LVQGSGHKGGSVPGSAEITVRFKGSGQKGDSVQVHAEEKVHEVQPIWLCSVVPSGGSRLGEAWLSQANSLGTVGQKELQSRSSFAFFLPFGCEPLPLFTLTRFAVGLTLRVEDTVAEFKSH